MSWLGTLAYSRLIAEAAYVPLDFTALCEAAILPKVSIF